MIKKWKGKRKTHELVKTYRFKETIPQVQKTIEVEHYNYGEWCVSERSWTTEKVITVYDEKIMQSIKERTLQFYLQQNTQP